jgi:hypothetical protein
MIKSINKKKKGPIEIDLNGPEGNAFYLMGMADNFAKQLSWTKEQRTKLRVDLTFSDYENLINTFDKHFGDFVILYR